MTHTACLTSGLAVTGICLLSSGSEELSAVVSAFYQGTDPREARKITAIEQETNHWQRVLDRRHTDTADLAELTRELLQVAAAGALRDAGFQVNPYRQAPVALIIIQDQAAGQVDSDSLCTDLHISGPAMTYASEIQPLCKALAEAQDLLLNEEVEAVVVAGLDLCRSGLSGGNPSDSVSDQPLLTMGFDRQLNEPSYGSAAGAIVLIHADGLADYRQMYAHIEGFVFFPADEMAAADWHPEAQYSAVQALLDDLNLSPTALNYIEAAASGIDAMDVAEMQGLQRLYAEQTGDPVCALGSITTNLGYLPASAGLLAFIRSSLCLYHRFIPAVPGWSGPKEDVLKPAGPFYVPQESRAWFARNGTIRRAGVSVPQADGSYGFLVTRAAEHPEDVRVQAMRAERPQLILLTATDSNAMLQNLADFERKLTRNDLANLARQSYVTYQQNRSLPYTLALLGTDVESFQRDIQFGLKAIPRAIAEGGEWRTPAGTYFSGQPLGAQAGVAFVYPGAFNSYVGAGQDLFFEQPWLFERLQAYTSESGALLHEHLLYPRHLLPRSAAELRRLEAELVSDPIAMSTSGTILAVMYTLVMRDLFDLQPNAAFGYSLGEISMLYAMGVWNQGDQMSAGLRQSALFKNRLAAPHAAVREFWHLSDANSMEPVWSNYVLKTTQAKVAASIAGRERVYITHVNAPDQVVLAGDARVCEQVIAELGCTHVQAPFDYVLHCEAMRSEFDELRQLHDCTIARSTSAQLYSAAEYAPLLLDRDVVADNLAGMLCAGLDFPRLVETVYQDGARVFVELGAGSNCALWTSRTLKGKPHLAVALNQKNAPDSVTLLKALAKLASHKVSINLSRLYA